MARYKTGEIAGAATATQLPDIGCTRVRFRALTDNAGNVYLGFTSGVTAANGTTDVTTGWLLDAGDESPWIYVVNLNKLYKICDNAGDDFVYLAEVGGAS